MILNLTIPRATHPNSKSDQTRLPFVVVILVLVWVTAICCGMTTLVDYGAFAGEQGNVKPQWPVDSQLERSVTQPTLLMFIHPQCPCTRASIGELAELMATCGPALKARVLVLAPAQWDQQAIQSDIWQAAAAIPGVTVQMDPEGREALRFGALTSGMVLLYGPQGDLRFRGGITGARGHSGLNAGRAAVASLIIEHERPRSVSGRCSVFGCPLFSAPTDDLTSETAKRFATN